MANRCLRCADFHPDLRPDFRCLLGDERAVWELLEALATRRPARATGSSQDAAWTVGILERARSRIAPRHAVHAAARVGGCRAQVQALDRRPVAEPSGGRPEDQLMVDRGRAAAYTA